MIEIDRSDIYLLAGLLSLGIGVYLKWPEVAWLYTCILGGLLVISGVIIDLGKLFKEE